MAVKGALPDYYAVLQVQPDADIEVISAAYRQLMKKYHPDVAGGDPHQIADHHRRSKEINEAFGVLRDTRRRKQYDEARLLRGSYRPPSGAAEYRHTYVTSEPPHESGPPQPAPETHPFRLVVEHPPLPYLAPFRLVAQAYDLLPGRYEWESQRRGELLTILLLPLIGTVGFCLLTGRLAPVIGHTLTATLIVWSMLALTLVLMWQSLPRIAVAVVPTLAVVSGFLDPVLSQAHMPAWMAAAFLGCLSLFLAGRQFVFGVLPTIGICWLLTRIG